MDYKDAGVDVEAGRAFVNQIRDLVHSTFRPEVIGGLGGFSGCFQLPGGFKEPVLVSGTDGVGTKLKIAHMLNRHDTVGIDLVAMCVNDVLTSGAEPLFFLDYVATGKLDKQQLTQVVSGIASGCKLAGCALLGGETAEMPGFYQTGEYDLAGFSVGIVEKSQMLNGSQSQIGDVAIALASAGLHSNGFSLVRKIVSEKGFSWSDRFELFDGQTLGEVFLTPTRIYVKPVLSARQAGLEIHGMAHITGGGLPENLPRCLNQAQAIKIEPNSWSTPPVFKWLAEVGSVSQQAMYNTFNMGIGFVLLVPPHQAEQAISYFKLHNIAAYKIGEVISGSGELMGLPV
ncbi:phosphoribosylformylglycinamidine cyclo-ligase [Aetokthonos hydrillicola Thurmond2011]|jgi:phosphoribosylformylglycinamidine cyclo-ligase|uniref:Phosphoribosylformylglycinamidine cyclo-ligase n=1 Tax=Aetokthonos hydrillicola Thurmond2011 TaxID=2712845 RepID=A0AAP5I6R0_9CYAN|nr:phosphoribosylformylglycinamidine cyclo-ligase [Aetokthonos hydrillicola]MBO3457644.1 phosphoribosylformylglycinamidine cyclo-ligase [Aetokthonos hydrillicola CCALA 1050]MBW4587923.1 phosphoribosylformylglycinamidine cyclo-ligase [Aetokthonos hydrillicola CCALA 1050]MDR9894672.1 phosphoribosylformylglycinamidine cyclo-ligase [Aetokthonos hydrillicola Thurmond2011]